MENAIILSNGKFESPSFYQSLETIVHETLKKQDAPLVVHFHGGLVNLKHGQIMKDQLHPVYQSAGADTLFFLWQSGILDTIKNRLKDVFENSFFNKLIKYIATFVKGKADKRKNPNEFRSLRSADSLNVVPLSELPEDLSDLDQEEQWLVHTADLSDQEKQDLYEKLNEDSSLHYWIEEELSTGLLSVPEEENVRGMFIDPSETIYTIRRIITQCMNRFNNGTNHGVYVTIVEEVIREMYLDRLSQNFWKNIKGNAKNAFKEDPNLHGGTAFLDILKQSEIPANKRIVLIGHSTGAISICYLLQEAKKHKLDYQFDVVFLAAACSFNLMSETLDKSKDLIRNIRVFGLSDAVEKEDSLSGEFGAIFKHVYPYSLLYFVSGIAEEAVDMPLVGMERYYENRAPYAANKSIKNVLAYLKDRLVWAISTGNAPGWNSDAKKHGAFDDITPTGGTPINEATIHSLKHLIKNDF